MLIKKIALAGACIFHAAPALAGSDTRSFATGRKPAPRPITALMLGEQRVEMLAVTARARADTKLRKDYLHESRSFSKVMPGYPQPAFVSVDFRIKF